MNPHTKHTSLFFTPRTPWGTRLQRRTFHNHMRASEDDKEQELDPQGTPKGLSGQIQYDDYQRGAPGSLSGQLAPNSAGGAADQMWKTPDTRKQQNELMAQQARQAQQTQPSRTQDGPLSAANQERAMQATLHQWSGSSPVVFGKGEPDSHVEGNVSVEGEGGLRPSSIDVDAGVSLPRAMYTGPRDDIIRPPLPIKSQSGRIVKNIRKGEATLNADPADFPRKKQ